MAEKPATKAKVKSPSIAKAPIRRLMKNEGAALVSDEAVSFMIDYLVKAAEKVTKDAVKVCKDDKRKRIMGSDITSVTN